ncbi:hypothetical protein H2201_003834 [Coniosporium apollinis]|uniref:FZ domain-containing protein n=1 Tax=Coniosporium apollinis TaxID=61459 RepID=A0ABQ9NUU2_9PEZI|nr:hypothetical protein H2201_003834 [Coniosporium apollinis]
MALPCFKLTPLQSRFAASLTASILVIIIYLSLYPPRFAYAAELDSILNEDHNHLWLLDELLDGDGALYGEEQTDAQHEISYEADFLGVHRSIIGRAEEGAQTLRNNVPGRSNGQIGLTDYWEFPSDAVWGEHGEVGEGLPSPLEERPALVMRDVSELEEINGEDAAVEGNTTDLKRRQTERPGSQRSRTVYISIDVCQQPTSNGTTTTEAPQLIMYVSTSEQNTKPGPDKRESQANIPLVEGFAQHTVNATGAVYIGVHEPDLQPGLSGAWNYEVTASIDAPYHSHHDGEPLLLFVDSDTTSALLVTDNLTQANASDPVYRRWMDLAEPPFTMYAFSKNETSIRGLQRSYCGLDAVPSGKQIEVTRTMTNRGLGNKPKEQFHIRGLNGSTTYHGFLAMRGNSTASGDAVISGGGHLWSAINFTTKSDANCRIISNLTFCTEVAYAVPSNDETFPSATDLANLYNARAEALYENFTYSLDQIACNTTSTARYSLARNCTDCAAAYKTWLCAVTIPRCEDFSAPASLSYLQPRNIGQAPISQSTFSFTSNSNSNSTDAEALAADTTLRNRLYANSSRNPLIDQQIRPGPYKEVLPCEDLCYALVQSCPAKLGFSCPLPGKGLEKSYGRRSGSGRVECSFPGEVFVRSAAAKGVPGGLTALLVAVLVGVFGLGGW